MGKTKEELKNITHIYIGKDKGRTEKQKRREGQGKDKGKTAKIVLVSGRKKKEKKERKKNILWGYSELLNAIHNNKKSDVDNLRCIPTLFLVADTRLYTLPCRSFGPSVRP